MGKITITLKDEGHSGEQITGWLKQRIPTLVKGLNFHVEYEASPPSSENVTVRGEISFPDGEVAQFSADSAGEFLQWGNTKRTLGQTVLAVEEISRVLVTEFGDESHG
jgi:hypothetical protein